MKSNFTLLLKAIREGELVKAVMSSPWRIEDRNVKKISIRKVVSNKKSRYQVSEYIDQKVFHKNLEFYECEQLVKNALSNGFKQGIFQAISASFHVLVNKQREMNIVKKEIQEGVLNNPHNRLKKYLLQEGDRIPFLIALGIMSEDGKVLSKKYDKFRQINRFVEMVRDIIDYLPNSQCIEIIDFGCGKAYLTFALYHYLHNILKREVNILGLDLKVDVINDCQILAANLGYKSLQFAVGDINRHETKKKIDLVISLHACDIATDAAIEKAVRWDAKVILCVPCCQHELYLQIVSKPLKALLRHGILKERFAALATDAARAELLTILGYDVQILEFIDMEHTPKNLLIRAVKMSSKDKQRQGKERYDLFKKEINIFPSLEKRFQNDFFDVDR